MKTPEAVSEWYNRIFFKDGESNKPEQAVLGITLRHESGTLEIPRIRLSPDNKLHEIIASYHEYLKEEPREVDTVTQKPKTEEEPPPVDVGQVEYRNNLYIVEQTGEEDFVVLRQDRTEVNPKSPLAKAVVKRFRKSK